MMVKLIVQDDGIGLDGTRHSYGLGLTNMQNRAGLYKGKLTFNSSPGNGCTIKVKFPTVNNEVVAADWENASPGWETAQHLY
jgi:nitrate/nitrite-specific signal transduction histidine kinase